MKRSLVVLFILIALIPFEEASIQFQGEVVQNMLSRDMGCFNYPGGSNDLSGMYFFGIHKRSENRSICPNDGQAETEDMLACQNGEEGEVQLNGYFINPSGGLTP
jgi:hypothetical protein